MNHRRNNRKSEAGSALVAVLCLVFMAGLLTTAVLAMSKYNTFTVTAHLEIQKSLYINEGAATRVQYLLAADRSLYSTTQPGETDYSEYDTDRFMADGVVHVMDYYGTAVEFTITDARSGFDLSAGNYTQTLNRLSNIDVLDTDLSETISALQAAIGDYIDTDDTVLNDGFEESDYDAEGMSPLPRNGNPQFREELAWVPGVLAMFPPGKDGRLSSIRLIPPSQMSIPNGTPSIFTADRLLLKTYCSLEDEAIDRVLEALEIFRMERTLLSDQLDVTTLPGLHSLSWEESGAYTVTVGARKTLLANTIATADAGEGSVSALEVPTRLRPSGKLTFTWNGFDSSGPQNQMIQYMEWMYH